MQCVRPTHDPAFAAHGAAELEAAAAAAATVLTVHAGLAAAYAGGLAAALLRCPGQVRRCQVRIMQMKYCQELDWWVGK